MQALAKFLAVLLGIALAVTAVVYTLNATIWDASYMQTKLGSQQVADDLAAVLPDLAAKLAGSPEETKAAVAAAITPEYVRDQLTNLVPQVVAYYKSAGQPPVVDLRDVQARVEAEGLALPDTLKAYIQNPQPVTVGSLDSALFTTSRWLALLSWAAPLAAFILAVLVFLMAGHRRWLTLAIGVATGAALTLTAALISYAPTPLASSALNTSNLKLLSPVVHSITDAIAHDQVAMIINWAKGYGLAAVILLLIHLISRLFGGRHRHKKSREDASGSNIMPSYN